MRGVCHDRRLCGGSTPCVRHSRFRTVSQHASVGRVPEALACVRVGDRPFTFLSPPLAILLVQSSCSRITHMFICTYVCAHIYNTHTRVPGASPLEQGILGSQPIYNLLHQDDLPALSLSLPFRCFPSSPP